MTKAKTDLTLEADDLPINTGALIARICKAASERWKDDESRPGIQIAHLPGSLTDPGRTGISADGVTWASYRDPQWYVALHRYGRSNGNERIVQYKALHTDLDRALLLIAALVADVTTEEREGLATLLAATKKAVG